VVLDLASKGQIEIIALWKFKKAHYHLLADRVPKRFFCHNSSNSFEDLKGDHEHTAEI
jgi:hypothetical protein